MEVIDTESGIVVKDGDKSFRISWVGVQILDILGYERALRRKDIYAHLPNFSEGQIDYGIEILLKHRLIKKNLEKKYILTTKGKEVWQAL